MGWKLIVTVMRSSRGELLWTTVVGLLAGLASAGVIVVVSSLLTGGDGIRVGSVLLFLVMATIALVGRVVSQYLVIRLAQRSVCELRMGLARRVLSTPFETLERHGTGKLLAVLTEDVAAITDGVGLVPFLLVNLMTVVGCLIYLSWLSIPAFLTVVLFLGLGIASYRWMEKRALQSMLAARRVQDRLVEQLTLMTRGLKELLLHAERRQDFLTQRLGNTACQARDHMTTALGSYAVAGTWAQLLLFALLGILLFVLPARGALPAETVVAYCLVLLYMLRPIDFVLQILPLLGRGEVALGKIESLNLSHADAKDPVRVAPLPPWSHLSLHGVRHRYSAEDPDDAFELGPIDLELRAGEIAFLVGGNGSGKTTLAKVLVGLYVPSAGEIRVDGKKVEEADREAYRQQFTVLFADACVLPWVDSFSSRQADRTVSHLLRSLHLDAKVQLEGDELRTAGLSQGQLKRLALLCAYLDDRPIYVFDEWAAEQDPGFREVFYQSMLPELRRRGKCVVVISHDERFFQVADRLIKLEEGKLA